VLLGANAAGLAALRLTEEAMQRALPFLFVLVLALTIIAGIPGTAKADDVEGTKQEEVNLLAPRFDLTIWTIVVFVLLLVVMSYVKLPGSSAPAFVMMMQGLKKREHNIQSAIADAQKAREDAQQLREQMQKEVDKTQDKVREILDEARKNAQVTVDDMMNKARNEITAERDRLRREIDFARDQALQQLWTQTAQIAALVSSKAIRRQMTAADHRNLVDEAIAELRQAGEGRQRELASVQA
jgi:F-type H+-transporting ATPase subunit b